MWLQGDIPSSDPVAVEAGPLPLPYRRTFPRTRTPAKNVRVLGERTRTPPYNTAKTPMLLSDLFHETLKDIPSLRASVISSSPRLSCDQARSVFRIGRVPLSLFLAGKVSHREAVSLNGPPTFRRPMRPGLYRHHLI